MINHVDQKKYIKTESNPIFNDEGSTIENENNISLLLKDNKPPLEAVSHYSGEKRQAAPNEVDDVNEMTSLSKQPDIFPQNVTNEHKTRLEALTTCAR